MTPLIINEEVEVYEKQGIQKIITNLLDFNAWVEKNYQKYHNKNDTHRRTN